MLGLVVCDHLYHQYPDQAEGRLARVKAQLVSTEQLAEQARTLQLGQFVQFGRGERQTGKDKASVLADTLEAIIGAIYLDRGFEAAQSFILRQMSPILHDLDALTPDYKSTLQERAQREYQVLPDYRLVSEEGPSHDKTFVLQVSILGNDLGQGSGRSKREAGQQAAAEALVRLESLAAPLTPSEPGLPDPIDS